MLITKDEMILTGQEDGWAEENLQQNQATRVFGTHRWLNFSFVVNQDAGFFNNNWLRERVEIARRFYSFFAYAYIDLAV